MTVCTYFRQGNCKFGPRCKFEHPRNLAPQTGSGSVNRSATFSNSPNTSFGDVNAQVKGEILDFSELSTDRIKTDLSSERPSWPFTCYCPLRYGFDNLIKDVDVSFEEARLGAYEAVATGSMPSYEQALAGRVNSISTQVQTILANLAQAIRMCKENNKRPQYSGIGSLGNTSRQTSLNTNGNFDQSNVSTSSNPFGTTTTNASAFGQSAQGPSAFSQAKPTSVFGQTGQTASVFGQLTGSGQANTMPSAFSKSVSGANDSQSAFGQPSAFGQTSSPFSAFGTHAIATNGAAQTSSPFPAFGRSENVSSAFGQTAVPASAFGQPSTLASGFGQVSTVASTFGRSNNFASTGQSAKPMSVFGAASHSGSTFGHPSTPVTLFGQGSSTFPSSVQPITPLSPFGHNVGTIAGSAFGQTSAPASAFGQSNVPVSATGQTASPQSAFGQTSIAASTSGQVATPSLFDQSTAPVSAFGQAATAQVSPFGASNIGPGFAQGTGPQPAFGSSAFGTQTSNLKSATTSGSAFSTVNSQHSGSQNMLAQSKRANASDQLDGISDAFPAPSADETTADTVEIEDLPEEILAQFRAASFTLGQIPEIPPPPQLITKV